MNRISNPYNIHALYQLYNPWSIGQQCPMYCPTTNLPPTQIKLGVSSSGSTVTGKIINPDTGYELDVTSKITKTCTTAGTFVTYSDSALATDLDEGMYQLKLDVAGTEYYGYPYCAMEAYKSAVPAISANCSSSGAGSYTLTFSTTAGSTRDNFAYKFEYNIGSGWVTFGTTSGAITEADWGDTGTVTGYIRINAYRGNSEGYRVYYFSLDTSSPCPLIPEAQGEGGVGVDNFAYLEWTNANDLQNLGLYYAGGYTQRFYFQGEEDFPTPILEDNFIANGTNGLFLESAITAEQANLDFYPLPPHAASILSSVRLHDNIDMRSLWTLGVESNLVNFSFTPNNVEGALCQSGRFSWQRNRQYVGGCQEDYTTQSCS